MFNRNVSYFPVIAVLLFFVATLHSIQSAHLAYAVEINELEPNDDSDNAQAIATIGRDNVIVASTGADGDIDWYRINGVAGETYTAEIFEASASLNNSFGTRCDGASDEGLGLRAFDASVTLFASACEPNDRLLGSGNVHNLLQFTVTVTGPIYVAVIPNSVNVTGNYKLRILQGYTNPSATWDSQHEPNNNLGRAAPIGIGRTNALTSSIEERLTTNATNSVDIDWFRFVASPNTTYTVELFNVDINFDGASGTRCNGLTDEGIGLQLFDVTGTALAAACEPNDSTLGSGNVHNILRITPGATGTYFIRVVPNNQFRVGSYSIRVLPQFDDSSASWDADFEPNNTLTTAAPIKVGRENEIISNIEARTSTFSTNSVDYDWYHFDASANTTYTIEIFNANINFDATSGTRCNGFSDEGLGLVIFDVTGVPLETSCEPNDAVAGSGNVHNLVRFKPGLSGTYFILVIPNNNTRFGTYSLRVLRQYNDPLATWDDNFEPNNVLERAAPLQIGRERSIQANIEERVTTYSTNSVDFDWYQFDAAADTAYSIELYNVDINFNGASGARCDGFSDEGIGMELYDISGTRLIDACEPNDNRLGSANIHNRIQIEPGFATTYFVRLAPNANDRNGNYELRVLPDFNDPLATWDTEQEPNNVPATAFLLPQNGSFISSIEQRRTTFSTNSFDRDWYRLQAIEGQTYIIETFDVANNLQSGSGTNCTGSTRSGLGILIYDENLSTVLAEQCVANGQGDVHTSLEFVPTATGTYFVWIIPNASMVFGQYGVRLNGPSTPFVPPTATPFPQPSPSSTPDPQPSSTLTPVPTLTSTPSIPTVARGWLPFIWLDQLTSLPAACTFTESEPNDRRVEADRLPSCSETTINARLGQNEADIAGFSDQYFDNFSFLATASGPQQVTLSNIPVGSDYDLLLFDSVNAPVAIGRSERGGNQNEAIDFSAQSGKTYYITVRNNGRVASSQAYRLYVVVE